MKSFSASVLLLTLLFLPTLILLIQPSDGTISLSEQRRLSQFPKLGAAKDWLDFPTAFDDYFSDRFGGRQALTTLYRHLIINGFHRSPVKKLLIGSERWLFLTGEGGDVIDLYHRNVKPFTAGELGEIHDEMSRRREWVTSWGGEAVFVIVPNKETIYPEQLPPLYQLKANPQSRYDQWKTIFLMDPSLVHIDLRPTLLAAKDNGLVYYRSDSHWNIDGAYIGYQSIISVLNQWFPTVVPVKRPEDVGTVPYRGDLAKMLGVGGQFDEPDQVDYRDVLDESLLKCAKPVPLNFGALQISDKSAISVYECDNPDLPSAVIVRDSMANRWLPLLPDNFRRLVVMYNWFPDAAVIARERPDVVIFENVERSIHQFLLVRLDYDPETGQAHFVNP